MDNRKRRKLIIAAIASAVQDLGFKHHQAEYFSRSRGPLLDTFFFQKSRSKFRFTISYGIDKPGILDCLSNSSILAQETNRPHLTIVPPFGRLGPYGCKYEEHIENAVAKIANDFRAHVIPWCNQITTTEELVEYYRTYEVRDNQVTAPPQAHSCLSRGIYGMMLVDIGETKEAVGWLKSAQDYWQVAPKSEERDEWLRLIEVAIQDIT